MKIVVVGGGASGMTAAITAAKKGAKVTVLEHRDRVGKKILSTGNGRCNFTNLHMSADCFRGASPEFITGVLSQFSEEDTLRFFEELGILAKEKNGCIYPYSEQASAVLDVLRFQMEQLGVAVRTEEQISNIFCKENFVVKTNHGSYDGDRLILACGGQAARSTGSDGSGYVLAKAFGHNVIRPVPALVQLCAKDLMFPGVAGVRCDGQVTLYVDGEPVASDRGELQLTEYGISGIPVFQVSRFAAKALALKRQVFASLNFLPDFSEQRLYYYFLQRAVNQSWKTMEQFLTGIFPKKLAVMLLKKVGLSVMTKAEACPASSWKGLADVVLDYRMPITDTKGFDSAQVCAGGVDTREVDEHTLESRLVKNLYFAGELLDVDGICGGYNLQWAWSSGYVSGFHAAEE